MRLIARLCQHSILVIDYTTKLMLNFNGDDRVVQFAAGFHKSIAITTSGKVYVWCNNDNGQLGLQGDTGDEYRICTLVDGWLGDHVNNCYNGDIYHAKRSPTLLSDYNFATVFAAGDALFAIGRDGSVYSWGRGNTPGQGNITGDVHYEAATVMGTNMDSIANIFIDINGNDQMDNDEICQMADSSQRTGGRIYCTIPTSSEDCC